MLLSEAASDPVSRYGPLPFATAGKKVTTDLACTSAAPDPPGGSGLSSSPASSAAHSPKEMYTSPPARSLPLPDVSMYSASYQPTPPQRNGDRYSSTHAPAASRTANPFFPPEGDRLVRKGRKSFGLEFAREIKDVATTTGPAGYFVAPVSHLRRGNAKSATVHLPNRTKPIVVLKNGKSPKSNPPPSSDLPPSPGDDFSRRVRCFHNYHNKDAAHPGAP